MLYIHVPFCRRKCNYCSFISYASREVDIPSYVTALQAEMSRRARGERLRSIYFGGGTPSLLSIKQVADILATVNSLFLVETAAEITVEANPGTVDLAYLTALRELGVNRLSLGVQSLDDAALALLGRIHSASEAREAVPSAREAGFTNLNLDLIYGLPGQSLSDWRGTLEEAVALGPEHLSLYGLTLEAETPIWRLIEEGSLPEIDPDVSADQYELAGDLLAANGYSHYEISNWAQPGSECRHNLAYWQNEPYIGVGVAAHSCLNGHRFANTSSLDKYITAYAAGLPPELELDEEIDSELQLAETVILGLRLCGGISLDDISRRFGINFRERYRGQVTELTACGLLEYSGGRLKLTPRGRLLSNEVFWRFLPAEASCQR